MRKHISCIVSGRVQGVLYRVFTKNVAERLDIKGEVENLSNGTVRIEAEGEETKLEEFKKLLGKGSTFSKVENISCESFDGSLGFEGFKIKRGHFLDRF